MLYQFSLLHFWIQRKYRTAYLMKQFYQECVMYQFPLNGIVPTGDHNKGYSSNGSHSQRIATDDRKWNIQTFYQKTK